MVDTFIYLRMLSDFKDSVAGIRWLDATDNRALFGTATNPGPLFANFAVVDDVLRRNRADVFVVKPEEYLIRTYEQQVQ